MLKVIIPQILYGALIFFGGLFVINVIMLELGWPTPVRLVISMLSAVALQLVWRYTLLRPAIDNYYRKNPVRR